MFNTVLVGQVKHKRWDRDFNLCPFNEVYATSAICYTPYTQPQDKTTLNKQQILHDPQYYKCLMLSSLLIHKNK